MKTSNKAISILLTLVTLLSLLSVTASAISSIGQVNLEVDITDGTVLGDWDEYITIKTDNVVYDDFNGNSCVDAMCTDDYTHILPTGVFESGKSYEMRMFFTVEEGYCFADSMSVTVNGITVAKEDYSVGYETSSVTGKEYQYLVVWMVDFSVEPKQPELTEINKVDIDVDITDGTVLGDWNEYITIKTENVVYDDFNGNSCVDAMCTDDYTHILPTGVFESGKSYEMRMFFAVEEGYCFADTVNVTVNGKTVAAKNYNIGYEISSVTGEEYQYLVILMEFDIPEETVELTFWQKVINFFLSIYNFFLGLFM